MSHSDSILDAFRGRMATADFARADMVFSDFRVVDRDSARVLFAFDKDFGRQPTLADIQGAVARTFDGQFSVVPGTATVHANVGALSTFVTRNSETRPMADAERMMAMGSAQFLDQAIGDIWRAEESEDGAKFLRRIAKDDLSQILATRRQRLNGGGNVRAYFGEQVHASLQVLNVGDEVSFFANHQVRSGIVTAIASTEVTVKSEGRPYAVVREAISAIEKASPQTKESLRSYYSQLYPADFVNQMLQGVK